MTPPRRCSTPYCNHPAQRGGQCQDHRQARDTERKVGTIYRTARWRRVRAEVLNATPSCNQCGNLATDVDHIKPINDGGSPWDWHNLQALCHACHSRKTALERL